MNDARNAAFTPGPTSRCRWRSSRSVPFAFGGRSFSGCAAWRPLVNARTTVPAVVVGSAAVWHASVTDLAVVHKLCARDAALGPRWRRLFGSARPDLPTRGGAVTEIPEHLLKRSRDRRLHSASVAATRASASTRRIAVRRRRRPGHGSAGRTGGTRQARCRPAAAGRGGRRPPPPKPDPPYVAAYKRAARSRSGRWPASACCRSGCSCTSAPHDPPEVPPARSGRRRGLQRAAPAATASSGEGGVGRRFADGEVLKTFPHIEDQLRFVYFGTEQLQPRRRRQLRRPRPRGRPARRVRSARCPARGSRPAATSPTPRSSPSSATSATRSAAPIQRTSTWTSSRLVLRGVADLRRPGGRHDFARHPRRRGCHER